MTEKSVLKELIVFCLLGIAILCHHAPTVYAMDCTHDLNVVSVSVSPSDIGEVLSSGTNPTIQCGGSMTACRGSFCDATGFTPYTNSPYMFDRWEGDCAPNGQLWGHNPPSTSLTCTAYFAEAHYIDVYKNGAGSGTITYSPAPKWGTTYLAGTAVTITATPSSGSTFGGWSAQYGNPYWCDTVDGNKCYVTMNTNRFMKATFNAIPYYTLTVSKSGTGTGTVTSSPGPISCGVNCSGSFSAGTVITLTAAPSTNSLFAGWSGGGCTGTGNCALPLNVDTTVTALFNPMPKISVAPVSDSFGNVYINSTSTYHVFTVSNAGTANLLIGIAALTGTNASEFVKTYDSCSAQTIAPSSSCTIQVALAPTSTGTKTANLAIPSNDPYTPTLNVSMNGTGVLPMLTVAKNGTGTGTATSLPAGISCGTSCSSSFSTGTTVTLVASPSVDSSFAGWSGGGCSGTGNCVIVLNADTTVTATFTIKPPIANFTATPTTGYAPPAMPVNFTDTSTNSPTSWTWSFEDGTTSTLKNPTHAYAAAGTYSVTLTASNATGSSTVTKSNIITVQACTNEPVRIVRNGTPVYFSTVNAAYSSATDGETIQAHALTFTEGMDSYKNITLDGGYDCTYSSKIGYTTLKGSQINISGGTATIKDVVIDK